MVNLEGGDGVLMGEYVIRILLYADDLILIVNFSLGFQENVISLENFCRIVGCK